MESRHKACSRIRTALILGRNLVIVPLEEKEKTQTRDQEGKGEVKKTRARLESLGHGESEGKGGVSRGSNSPPMGGKRKGIDIAPEPESFVSRIQVET